MSDQTGPEADPFAGDFRDGYRDGPRLERGERRFAGPSAYCPRYAQGNLGGLEAGFLAFVDAAVRGGREGAAASPDLEKAKALLRPATPSAGRRPRRRYWDEVLRRGRERERAAGATSFRRGDFRVPPLSTRPVK